MSGPRSDMDKNQKDIFENVRRILSQNTFQKDPEAEKAGKEHEEKQRQKRQRILDFHLKPKDIKSYLDRFVIEQDDAKKVLATAVCDHYNHVKRGEKAENRNYLKQNVLMLGPTGVGKTYLIKCLAELIGVPFVKADATKFSETGYVGADVEDVVRDLVHKAEGDLDLARYGMVYIDEVDKIASAPAGAGRDVSGAGVQRGLLKIMEETDVPLRSGQDMQSQIQAMLEFQQKGRVTKPVINTRHILFIVSGAFEGLAPIVEKRLRASRIGFARDARETPPETHLFRMARTDDFIQFGFEPEFIGRLPVRVVCDPLTEENLYSILAHSEGSVLRQYVHSFEAYGIHMETEDAALRHIARLSAAEKTGARGLLTVCEKIFRDFKYELPSSHVRRFVLNENLVKDPSGTLSDILRKEQDAGQREIFEQIDDYEKNFSEKNQVVLCFDEEARRLLAGKAKEESIHLPDYLGRLLSNFPYGLGLIQKRRPRERYVLDRQALEEPDATLDRWVKEAYERNEA